MTPGEMFGIAGVGVAFVIVLVAIGASVCAVLAEHNKDKKKTKGTNNVRNT